MILISFKNFCYSVKNCLIYFYVVHWKKKFLLKKKKGINVTRNKFVFLTINVLLKKFFLIWGKTILDENSKIIYLNCFFPNLKNFFQEESYDKKIFDFFSEDIKLFKIYNKFISYYNIGQFFQNKFFLLE